MRISGFLLSFLVLTPATATALGRPYHGVLISDMATTEHTHVCVTGVVAAVRQEADGDQHIRVENRKRQFIIVEWTPSTRVAADLTRIGDRTAPEPPLPKVGRWGVFCGISREDKKHGWFEIHPLEYWKATK